MKCTLNDLILTNYLKSLKEVGFSSNSLSDSTLNVVNLQSVRDRYENVKEDFISGNFVNAMCFPFKYTSNEKEVLEVV